MAEYFGIGFLFWLGVIMAKATVAIICKIVLKLCDMVTKKEDGE